jgi:hypothetical protein
MEVKQMAVKHKVAVALVVGWLLSLVFPPTRLLGAVSKKKSA